MAGLFLNSHIKAAIVVRLLAEDDKMLVCAAGSLIRQPINKWIFYWSYQLRLTKQGFVVANFLSTMVSKG